MGGGISASAFTCGDEMYRLIVGRGGADSITGGLAGVERAGEGIDVVGFSTPAVRDWSRVGTRSTKGSGGGGGGSCFNTRGGTRDASFSLSLSAEEGRAVGGLTTPVEIFRECVRMGGDMIMSSEEEAEGTTGKGTREWLRECECDRGLEVGGKGTAEGPARFAESPATWSEDSGSRRGGEVLVDFDRLTG